MSYEEQNRQYSEHPDENLSTNCHGTVKYRSPIVSVQ